MVRQSGIADDEMSCPNYGRARRFRAATPVICRNGACFGCDAETAIGSLDDHAWSIVVQHQQFVRPLQYIMPGRQSSSVFYGRAAEQRAAVCCATLHMPVIWMLTLLVPASASR